MAGEACMAGGICIRGKCMAGGRGVGMHGRGAFPPQIPRDMVNEQAVRILLECILVLIVYIVYI